MENSEKPAKRISILVTGASGFIGRHFLNAIKDDFHIYAVARKSQKESGIPPHPNIVWVLGDISNPETVKRITDKIAAKGGVDFIFHFAGYYDYDNKDKPEYYQTNVNGTKYILENTEKLNIIRFFYSSSLTVTEFSGANSVIDETSPADSDAPYPRSKALGERLVKEYSQKFPCTIVRVAAIFSDWCEFGPLYMLLSTWLSPSIKSRVLGGKGKSAIPYLHIIDLINFFLSLMQNQDKLSRCNIILASSDFCVSHKELFELATRYSFGQSKNPHLIPKMLSYLGIVFLYYIGKIIAKPTFERPWMAKYIDQQMNVNTFKTQEMIDWMPIPRYHIKRRLLYLIENMKSNPVNWKKINKTILEKTNRERPNVKIYEAILSIKDKSIEENIAFVTAKENARVFTHYQQLAEEELRDRIRFVYYMLEIAIHYGDRMHILTFIPNMARARYLEGFALEGIVNFVSYIGQHIKNRLLDQSGLKEIKQRIDSEITMTIQIIIDEIEDVYDRLKADHPCHECRRAGIRLCTHDAALAIITRSRDTQLNTGTV